MFKKLITITTIGGILIFFLLFFQKYIPYRNFKNSSRFGNGLVYIYLNQSNNAESTQALKYLNELTQIPLLGLLFDDERIVQLALLERYEQSLRQSDRALQNFMHYGSFTIWYIKALSECQLNRQEECQASLNKASRLSKKILHQQMIRILYEFIDTQFLQMESEQTGEPDLLDDKQDRLVRRNTNKEKRMKNMEEL